MKGLMVFLGRVDRALTAVIKWMTIVLFLVIGLIVVANILLRIFPFTSLHWADEIVELSFAWMVFFGAAAVWMVRGHFSVGDWIGALARGERGKHACRLVLELVSLLFVLVFFKYSLGLALRTGEATSVFQIPKKVLYACMPASTLIMVAYSLVFAARHAIGIFKPGLLEEAKAEAEAKGR